MSYEKQQRGRPGVLQPGKTGNCWYLDGDCTISNHFFHVTEYTFNNLESKRFGIIYRSVYICILNSDDGKK
jgi:hypothetical protein